MRTLFFFISIIALSGCSASHYLKREIDRSAVLSQQHTGVSIARIGDQKSLASYQDSKYFVPASNTKLFSFYAGLSALGDSIPGLEYLEWGELLIIRGTGDPSLLHPDLPHSKVFDFLKGRKDQIFFTPFHFENKRFGPGWAWSDYNDYYQAEVTAMPVYGNIARFKSTPAGQYQSNPRFWQKSMVQDTAVTGIEREELQNVFHYPKTAGSQVVTRDIPVHMTDQLMLQLLSDTLKKEVKLINIPLEIELQTVNSIPSDSLYTRMMQVSDNMLAEQLMLVYATANKLPLSTEKAIAHAVEHHLADLPDKPIWKDGSGLSRYNLFTPRTMVALLQKIYAKVPQERLFKILPAGGKSGTLKNLFKEEPPFIFAKTGSLSNVYNLSGYLITKKGKVLAFSFMNNNFTKPTADVRKEVERLLTGVRNKY